MPKSLDLRRLKKDLAAAPSRSEALAPGGRPATGLMDVVREHLDELLALQRSGKSWTAIAAGLTAQGFATADGRPITGSNLTGIVSSVRRQARRKVDRAAARERRPDLSQPPPSQGDSRYGTSAGAEQMDTSRRASSPGPRLAPELASRPGPQPADEPGPISEEEIRRVQAERHKHLFRKD